MNFRGSTYLPKGARNVRDTIWFEAHEIEDGYVVAKLTGNPDDIRQPWDIASRFNFSRKQPQRKRRTLPSSAVVMETVSSKEEALTALLAHEVEMLKTHKPLDIGDSNLERIKHYISLMDTGELPSASLPQEICYAVNDFALDRRIRLMFDLSPSHRRIVDRITATTGLYNSLAIA